MALNNAKLIRVTLASNSSSPRVHTYTTGDNIDTVKAESYFNGSSLRVSDTILATCGDGAAQFQVTEISPNVTVAQVTQV
ncbi:MAG: hypothetical protein LW807_07165 [Proteobacteria bacterium]|jgi:hypothetical protein|nr:hypothetical protein [Pseudomonadota bacterium]